jgi:hypothetical protein
MYILACNEPILNNTCPSGFTTVLLNELTPTLMTMQQFNELAPYTLGFLATCAVWRKLHS